MRGYKLNRLLIGVVREHMARSHSLQGRSLVLVDMHTEPHAHSPTLSFSLPLSLSLF